MLTRVGAVDLVVRGHHRARIALGDRKLEGEQVRLAQRHGIDVGAERIATGFQVVDGEVLHRGDHLLLLHAPHRRARHRARQHRVFARVLKVAAIARIANEVHAARKQHAVALAARFAADHASARMRYRGIEAGGGRKTGRQRDRAEPIAARSGDAEPGIGLVQCGQSEARYGRNEARALQGFGRVRRLVVLLAEVRADHPELLVVRHGRHDQLGAAVGRQRAVHPRTVGRNGGVGRAGKAGGEGKGESGAAREVGHGHDSWQGMPHHREVTFSSQPVRRPSVRWTLARGRADPT